MQKGGGFYGNKSGQVTIFIIVAVVIVAFAAAVYFFFPQLLVNFGIGTNNPQVFLQTCMQEQLDSVIDKVSLQGGSVNPENTILYKDIPVEYLCYTNQYYLTCSIQQPFLKQHIEEEIKTAIKDDAVACLEELRAGFERQGYGVNYVRGDIDVEILPKRVAVNFNNDLTLTKGDTQRYERLTIFSNNNLYELVGIANSILNWEARYGDSETTSYMNYYRNLKVEKIKQSDGSTVYILTDRNTGDMFQFASRSLAWPPGIGAEGVR